MKNKNLSAQELFIKEYKKEQTIISFARILLFVGFIIIWEALSYFKIIDSFFFSSPSGVILLFIDMCKNFEIFIHTGITLYETLLSFVIVNALSILIAILLLSFHSLSKITEPYLVILNSLPKSALAPLIIVWLGTGSKTIIVAGISVAVFGSIINLYTGFLQVDKEKLKLLRTLGGNKKDELLLIICSISSVGRAHGC